MLLKRYARREYLKKKLLITSTNSTELEKLTKIIRKTLSKNLNPTHLKKIFVLKALKQRDVKIKLSLTKHRIELLKDAITLITNNTGTNFLFAYADVHANLKIRLKDARNGQEVVTFNNEKDFNNLFAKRFFNFCSFSIG